MEEAVLLIESNRWPDLAKTSDNEIACYLKCLKLTGVEDNNRKDVALISHPAILPLYVFAPQYKMESDVPKEFRMTYFERYMNVESQVSKCIIISS